MCLFDLQGTYLLRNVYVDVDQVSLLVGSNLVGHVWKFEVSLFDERRLLHVCFVDTGEVVPVKVDDG